MLFVQSFKSEELKYNTLTFGRAERTTNGNRGKVLDKDGEVLAQSIPKYTFWVNTKNEFDELAINGGCPVNNFTSTQKTNLKRFYCKLNPGNSECKTR